MEACKKKCLTVRNASAIMVPSISQKTCKDVQRRRVAGRRFLTSSKRVTEFCLGSYQSGQMGLTVNQLAKPTGVRIPHCPPFACPCGAEVAHSLGKTGVMGSIPITGSCISVSGRIWRMPGSAGEKHCNVVFFFLSHCPNRSAVGRREAHIAMEKELQAASIS
jgi:hypothetical protein